MPPNTRDSRPRAHASRDEATLGVVDSLVQLSFLIQEVLGEAAARHDLTVSQARLLGILRDREPGMLELAKYLHLDKSSATGLIDRAERRGLVERSSDSADGRGVKVRVTALGRELTQRVTQETEARIAVLVKPLKPMERETISALASRIVLGSMRS